MYQYWSTNCRFVCILHLLHNSMPSHTSYTEIYMSDTCFCTVFNALLAHLTLSSTNFCFISYRCNCMYILQMLLYVYLQMLLYVYLTCPLDSAPLRRQPFLNFSEKEIYINKKSTTFMSILSLSLFLSIYISIYILNIDILRPEFHAKTE